MDRLRPSPFGMCSLGCVHTHVIAAPGLRELSRVELEGLSSGCGAALPVPGLRLRAEHTSSTRKPTITLSSSIPPSSTQLTK